MGRRHQLGSNCYWKLLLRTEGWKMFNKFVFSQIENPSIFSKILICKKPASRMNLCGDPQYVEKGSRIREYTGGFRILNERNKFWQTKERKKIDFLAFLCTFWNSRRHRKFFSSNFVSGLHYFGYWYCGTMHGPRIVFHCDIGLMLLCSFKVFGTKYGVALLGESYS